MRIAVLLAATLTSGMMAGLFYAYSISVMPALDAAGDTDPAATRQAFESRWVRWNHARTLLCTGSFASLCWALTQT